MPTDNTRGADTASVTELIALGRDREAVDAARRAHDRPSTEVPNDQGEPMDGVQQLDEILPLLEGLVDQLQPEQLDLGTPCAKLDVTGVLEHMIGGASLFAPAFRGDEGPAAADADGSVAERWGRAIAALASSVHAPGARERILATPFGEVPGATFARYVAFDGLMHGWDLSVATGLPFAPSEEAVRSVDAYARDFLQPELRDGDTFAQATEAPPDATDLDRLAAFSGRTVPSRQVAR